MSDSDSDSSPRRGEISVRLNAPDLSEEHQRVLSTVLASTLLSELARLEIPIREADWPRSLVGGGRTSGIWVNIDERSVSA